jgi:hypothetical protein
MQFKQFRVFFFLSIIIFLSSCLGTTNSTTVSSDATFVSLTFAKNDSIPYLNTAKFTLDADGQTIVNIDSLPYKIRVDSVYPSFSFKSSARAELYFPSGYKYKKDSATITGTDTIDFRKPIRVRNYASDAKTYKDYYVKVNVHQVDPELYIWSKITDNLNSINALNQKTIILNDKFLYYLNDGVNSYLYNSTNGYNWTSSTVNGLPANAPLSSMIQFNGKLYLTQAGDKIYSSADGSNWTSNSFTSADYTFKSIMFGLNDSLRAVTQSKTDQIYRFASSKDGLTWIIRRNNVVPDNFPASDFAAVTFSSVTGKAKGLILGGYSVTGSPLRNNWSTEDGAYWIDFSTENNSLSPLMDGAVIRYDNKLLLFGQVDDSDISQKTYYKVSVDEGLSWKTPDTLRNIIPSTFPPRANLSVVVDKNNRIFIIGGKSYSTIYSDVWTGMLNRKKFILQ